jgi:predicted  nucleic acid-binding Zn-ribbon protein
LSPALEAHYAQYFSDRAAVVAARQRTLGAREDEISRLRAEVDDLDNRIETLRATLISQRAAGDVRAYNATVETFNGLINRYNTSIDTLNAKIEEYNGLLGG